MSIVALKDVHDRCREDGGCWMWMQGKGSCGYPQAQIKGHGQKLVRRWVMEQKLGRPLFPRELVASRCGERLCCNPEHLKLTNYSEVQSHAWKSGARQPTSLNAQREKAAKSGFTRLNWEIVGEIRSRLAAGETTTAVAAAFGVHVSHVKRIRRGDAWREAAPAASVFSLAALGGLSA